MITFRFELKDGSTLRTRTLRARTLGEAQHVIRQTFPTWQVINTWERK